ncbi:hypothetical protein SynA15127_01022 [Synechococcus sp. A15-127]|nr:hypothetical protein SynA15127_01022 [Synechococcus sp. A15-127]
MVAALQKSSAFDEPPPLSSHQCEQSSPSCLTQGAKHGKATPTPSF